ncbi:LysR family transcriptional regulator [Sandaracinobacteroides saxicola]|uniref:LysR family transcriptional regulator n=1 Tax=Sandaracinobacteroides saxicola TaxID=2759707 RepID=A0A7G5IE85_9SPHN|nr:LysR family transcriptional regulator [Sandaracinobacteroides saxicola]QMW21677.1 LysR family transcriptional regulator [Sandaracinobacteroides saxicola]
MIRHLEELAVFARVGELKSISAAARALRMPKSSVSRAVARLEQELQARLVERSSRALVLTEAGAGLLGHAQAMVVEAENGFAEIAARQGNPRGLLRVAMPATMARSILAPELPGFLRRYPDVDLAVTVTDRLVNPVTDEYDVVVRAGWLEDSSVIVRKVAAIEMGLFASVGYVAAHGMPLTIEALPAHAVIGLSLPGARTLTLSRQGRQVEVPMARRFSSNDPVVAAEMVRAGLAIGQLARWFIAHDVAAGRIVEVLPDWALEDPPALYALYPSRTAMPPKVRVFLEFITDVANRVQRGDAGPHPERPVV